jgi:hypothetical protein
VREIGECVCILCLMCPCQPPISAFLPYKKLRSGTTSRSSCDFPFGFCGELFSVYLFSCLTELCAFGFVGSYFLFICFVV